jgi:hypothetical protein
MHPDCLNLNNVGLVTLWQNWLGGHHEGTSYRKYEWVLQNDVPIYIFSLMQGPVIITDG